MLMSAVFAQAEKDLEELLAKNKWTSEDYRNWESSDYDFDGFGSDVQKYEQVTETVPTDFWYLQPDLKERLTAAFGAEHVLNNLTISYVSFFYLPATGYSCAQLMNSGQGEGLLKLLYNTVRAKDGLIFWPSPIIDSSKILFMTPACSDIRTGGHTLMVETIVSHPNTDAKQEFVTALNEVLQATHDASDDALELDPN